MRTLIAFVAGFCLAWQCSLLPAQSKFESKHDKALSDSDAIELWQDSKGSWQVVVEVFSADQIAALQKSANKVDWNDVVYMKVASASHENAPQILGTVQVGKKLIFVPRFPLAAGTQYRVFVKGPDGRLLERATVQIPRLQGDPAKINAVYPSSKKLPENLLKFYVHFSAQMTEGDIYRHLHVREKNGDKIELPFLELEQELWSRDRKRVTILFDPGRIKRGLRPREEMGPIFESGKTYQFVISGKWKDAKGRPLGKDFVKEFTATKFDGGQPDPTKWTISPPPAKSKDALTIRFEKSLDHSMLQRVIEISAPNFKPVEGKVEISSEECQWTFVPKNDWVAGDYKILIDQELEDLAGNNIRRIFDVDVFEKTQPVRSDKKTVLQFSVK